MSQRKVILKLNKLKKYFPVRRGVNLKALEDVSLSIYEGEKFGVVGESGCGKSTLGRVVLQLYPQTSGAAIYHGKSLEEACPKYLEKELKQLLNYQSKAKELYQKSLGVDSEIAKLQSELVPFEAQGSAGEVRKHRGIAKRIDTLELKSKELKKDASRQLREGSRTVGSLILCESLPEIQKFYTKAYEAMLNMSKAKQDYDKYDARYAEKLTTGEAHDGESEKLLAEAGARMNLYKAEAKQFRDMAYAYHGKGIQMITERCDDPEYIAKLDDNFEKGINLGKLTDREMRSLRRDMQMIFQDPAASLDPRQSVGSAIEEVYKIHTDYGTELRREQTMELLEKVGLKREHYHSYPHMLSGGQKQRVGIARAIALNPKFIVLDESVSALDVSVQAQILQLLNDIKDEKGLTYFFITHNLGVVKHFCDRVMVMYLGSVCELANSKEMFAKPLHPYTESLLSAVPRPTVRDGAIDENVLQGEVPSAVNPPKGCAFHTRCPKCMDICTKVKPVIKEVEPERFVACHLYK